MTRRKFISLLLTLFAVGSALAQTSVELSAPGRGATVGTPFSITISVINPEGNVDAPAPPQLQGCEFRGGPSVSTMNSTQIINGRRSSSVRRDYTYTYVASAEGTVKVPSVNVKIGGKTFTTNPAQFSVSAARQGSGNGYPGAGGYPGGYDMSEFFDDPFFDDFFGQPYPPSTPTVPPASQDFKDGPNDLFVQIVPNRSSVYEQQPIEVAIKLYSSNQQVENLTAQGLPVFDGCLVETLPAVTNISWQPETVGGRQMYSAVIYRALIFPQRTGELTLKSEPYRASIFRQVMVQDIMGYRPYMETKEVELTPRSARISVKPLPEPKPANFSGAVGDFTLTDRMSSGQLRTNEAATLTLTFQGSGNIKFFTAPAVDFPSEFEVYEPNVTTDATPASGTIRGTRKVEYTFVPRVVGDFTLGQYDFVYFNPATGSYVTQTLPARELKVEQGANVSTSIPSSSVPDTKPKNTDIHHIKPGADNPSSAPDYLAAKGAYWAAYPIILVLFLAGCYVAHRRRHSDGNARKLKGAGKVAKKRLSNAGRLLRRKQYDAYYEELLRALQSYLSDKLQIPASQLSREKVMEVLDSRGASEETKSALINILNDCEMARYTPQSSGASEATFSQARDVINSIENLK